MLVLEEGRLLSRHVEGDERAFRQLMDAYRGPVFGYLIRTGVPAEARDDLFQEIFMKIHRGAGSYVPDRALKPWIFTIVANTVRSYFRKVKVREVVQSDGALVDGAEDQGPSGEELAEARETAGWIEAQMAALPLEQREVLLLTCVERMPMKDVAETLDMPINTVKTNLRRARIALANRLARRNLRAKREAEQ